MNPGDGHIMLFKKFSKKSKLRRAPFILVPLIVFSVCNAEENSVDGVPLGEKVATEQRAYAKSVQLSSFTLGQKVFVQNRSLEIPEAFQNPASRKCKPFCVQPNEKDNVEVITLEKLVTLTSKINSGEIILVDMRTPDWYKKGTLSSAINLPYSDLTGRVAKAKGRMSKLKGKPVIAFCNGWWCGQSNAGLKSLTDLGYEGKLYSFRGGVQDWVDAGLELITP